MQSGSIEISTNREQLTKLSLVARSDSLVKIAFILGEVYHCEAQYDTCCQASRVTSLVTGL